MLRSVVLLLLVATAVSFSAAQANLGAPQLQRYVNVGGGVDEINTGDLTVHISIPLASKGAYGPKAEASLDMDSRTYMYNYNNQGNKIYSSGGFSLNTSARYSASSGLTVLGNCNWAQTGGNPPQAAAFPAFDGSGTEHPALAGVVGCGASYALGSPGLDGWSLGVAIVQDQTSGAISIPTVIISPGGLVSTQPNFNNSPCNPPSQNFSVVDLQGNSIGDNLCFTGTSGVTTAAKGSLVDAAGNTVLAASLQANNVVRLSYPGPNGTNPAYTLTYTTYTLNMDFGCAGFTAPQAYTTALLTKVVYPDNSIESFTYESNSLHPGSTTGRIATVTAPTGATYTYTYTGGTHGVNCSDGSTSGITKATPDGSWTITHTASSGPARLSTTTIKAPSNDYVVDTIAMVPPNPTTPLVIPQMSTIASLVYDSSGALLSSKYVCYNGYHPASPLACATPPSAPGFSVTEMDAWTYVPGVNAPSLAVTLYDNYLRVVDEKTYGFGGTVGSTAFDTDVQTAYGSWNGSSCSNITKTITSVGTISLLDHVCYKKTFVPDSFGNSALANAKYFTYGLSGATIGQLLTEQDLIGGNLVTVDTRTYDSLGRVLTSAGPNGEMTTSAYTQCSGKALASVTVKTGSSSSLVTSYSGYDCLGEKSTITIDPNLNQTTVNYGTDPFWRPVSTTDAAGGVTSYTFTAATASTPATINLKTNITSSSSSETLTQFDSMGRVKLSQVRQGPSSSQYAITETDYDVNGRVRRVTLPYLAAAGTLNATIDGTITTYDGLGRKLSVTGPAYSTSVPGSTLTYVYNANDTQVTQSPAPAGEQTKSRQTEVDGLGRITSVCEITTLPGSGPCGQASPASGFLTTYAYYPGGKLRTIQQQLNGNWQIRTFTYDSVNTGRPLTVTTPEAGTLTSTYDSDPSGLCTSFIGGRIKTMDNGGGTSCALYDLADRPISQTFSGLNGSVSPTKNFVYDTTPNPNLSCAARNGAGKIVEISTGNPGAATPAKGAVTITGMESTTQTAPAKPGVGSITVSGSERSTVTSAKAGTGTVTINGSEQGGTFNMCPNTYPYNCPATIYDGGSMQVIVNGFSETVSWGQGSTGTTIASALASAFNGASGSPVTASASSNVLVLTAKATGANTNYSLSAAVPNHNTYFSSASFSPSLSGSTLSGGQDGGTVYDTGTVSATVAGPNGNFTVSVSYGSSSSSSAIASALANGFAGSGSPVSAIANGGTVTLTSAATGANTNYSFSTSASSANGFSPSSFGVSPTSSALNGGANAQLLSDAGTVSVTVGTFTANVSYGSGDFAVSLANKLANVFNTTAGSPVTATAYNGTVTLTTPATGSGADYNYSATSATNYPSNFPSPSFSALADGSGLAGGANASTLITDEGFCYDPIGRPTDQYAWSSTANVGYVHTKEAYFANGVPMSLSWVAGSGGVSTVPGISYTLDPMGRWFSAADANGNNLVTSTSYDLDGNVSSITFGNGDQSTYATYANFAPNAETHTIGTGTNNFVKHIPTWNSNGTLLSLQTVDAFNSGNSQNCVFAYDDLVRVGSDNCGSNWNQTYSYDRFGNVNKSGSFVWPPSGVTYNTKTNQYVNPAPPANAVFQYDPNGRLLTDVFDSLGWDISGNLISQSGTTFTYDAYDRPVASVLTGVPTLYFYAPDGSLFAMMVGSPPVFSKMFVATPASRAVYVGTSAALDHIDHYDWQHSARISSKWNRTLYSDISYDAFGMPYWTWGAINNQYAGLNTDISSGTEEVSASRRYHASQGRWESPDDRIPDLYDPQSFNAYVYVNNWPTGNTDPSGHEPYLFGTTGAVGDPNNVVANINPAYAVVYLYDREVDPNDLPQDGSVYAHYVGKADDGRAIYFAEIIPPPNVTTLFPWDKIVIPPNSGDPSLGIPSSPGMVIDPNQMSPAELRQFDRTVTTINMVTTLGGAWLGGFGGGLGAAGGALTDFQVTNFNRTLDVNTCLIGCMNRAVAAANAAGLTARQAASVARNPALEAAQWGNQYDNFFKAEVLSSINSGELPSTLQVTPRFKFGPDVFDNTTKEWWDLTTPGEWAKHVNKYSPTFGKGSPLFYNQNNLFLTGKP